jgi:hypothetical protein
MVLDIRRRRTVNNLTKRVSFFALVCGVFFVLSVGQTVEASQFTWGPENNGFSVGIGFDSAAYPKGAPVTGSVALRTSKTLSDKILCHDLSDYGFTIIPSGSTKPLPTTMSFGFSGPLEKLAKVLEPNTVLEQKFNLAQFFNLPPGRYSVQVERSVQYLGGGDAGPFIADPDSPVVFITIT